jgi:hypothetical protein
MKSFAVCLNNALCGYVDAPSKFHALAYYAAKLEKSAYDIDERCYLVELPSIELADATLERLSLSDTKELTQSDCADLFACRLAARRWAEEASEHDHESAEAHKARALYEFASDIARAVRFA